MAPVDLSQADGSGDTDIEMSVADNEPTLPGNVGT
jgi:hypothetical protein